MKLIFITNHYLNGNSGGAFASRAFANAFASFANQCVLLYPDNGKEIDRFIDSKYTFRGIKNTKNSLGKLSDIYTGKIHRFHNFALKEIKKFKPDLVVFDNSRCSAGIIQSVKEKGIASITIHHNYEMEYYQGSPPPWYYRHIFMHHMRKTEGNSVRFSDINLTLTNEDIDLLKNTYAPNTRSKFYTLGCFEFHDSSLPTTPIKNSDGLTFVITGNLSAYQTEISLIPFLEDYYPLLVEKFPKCQLTIAGRNPSQAISNICHKYSNINLVPNPVNMQDVIKGADVYICPTNVGGGLKLRIMDGLKAGLPVITHKISARGYSPFEDAGCLLAYEDKNSFTDSLNRIEKTLRQHQKPNIQELYHEYFSFIGGKKRLERILRQNALI